MNSSALRAAIAAAGLVIFTGPTSANDYSDWPYARRTLEGAWQVVVTVRVDAPDCATAALVPFGPNPFPAFNTFHQGGTMSEWGSRSPPANRSGGHGVWQRTGYNKFSYRLMFHSFDANGFLAATMDFSTDMRLSKSGETWEGVSRFVRTDLSGNALKFCATMTGERISLN